ncbi:unnamed protein product [Amoebophrya sp. A120]|nr:unnamed protein product [Amoebophrya sp. A120]|eukprot:GSA120T00019412001.1
MPPPPGGSFFRAGTMFSSFRQATTGSGSKFNSSFFSTRPTLNTATIFEAVQSRAFATRNFAERLRQRAGNRFALSRTAGSATTGRAVTGKFSSSSAGNAGASSARAFKNFKLNEGGFQWFWRGGGTTAGAGRGTSNGSQNWFPTVGLGVAVIEEFVLGLVVLGLACGVPGNTSMAMIGLVSVIGFSWDLIGDLSLSGMNLGSIEQQGVEFCTCIHSSHCLIAAAMLTASAGN